jgi:predicted acylesterase/phospholipase RssA
MDIQEYPKWIPNVLVLGPGGIKGYQILGALVRMYPRWLSEIDAIIGCSVGSIIALMICLGYNPNEIIEEGNKVDLFEDFKFSIIDFKDTVGILKHDMITSKLERIVKNKFAHDVTLKKLHDACDINFISVTLNKTKDEVEYINYKTHPDLSVVTAVLLSINIPILFEKMIFQGDTYIDGAFGNPFPIDILDEGENRILGITVETSSSIRSKSDDMISYIYGIFNSTIIQLKKRIIKSASSRCKILSLDCTILDMSGFSVKQSDKKEMLRKGFNEASDFIDCLIQEELGVKNETMNEFEIVDNTITKETDYIYIDKTKNNSEIFDDIIQLKTNGRRKNV